MTYLTEHLLPTHCANETPQNNSKFPSSFSKTTISPPAPKLKVYIPSSYPKKATPNQTGGMAYYINEAGASYKPEHGYHPSILSSHLLVGLSRVADINSAWQARVDRITRTYDKSIIALGFGV
jgi:hypothetical protein